MLLFEKVSVPLYDPSSVEFDSVSLSWLMGIAVVGKKKDANQESPKKD